MRILVVEDSKDMNYLIVKTLKKAGYSVDGCFDGEEAKLYLLGAEYDAILLDVMMPKLDGYGLLSQMRAQGNDTPVLFLTAKDTVSDRVKGLDLSVDIQKRTVTRGGKEISLIPKEFTILEHLIRNQGVVLSREQLENKIWNYEYSGSSNNMDVYMSRLRKKIDGEHEIKLIHTIRGVGWVLKEEV